MQAIKIRKRFAKIEQARFNKKRMKQLLYNKYIILIELEMVLSDCFYFLRPSSIKLLLRGKTMKRKIKE
jgi:hypothetical protein